MNWQQSCACALRELVLHWYPKNGGARSCQAMPLLNLEMVLIGCLQITSYTNIQVNEHIATEPSSLLPVPEKRKTSLWRGTDFGFKEGTDTPVLSSFTAAYRLFTHASVPAYCSSRTHSCFPLHQELPPGARETWVVGDKGWGERGQQKCTAQILQTLLESVLAGAGAIMKCQKSLVGHERRMGIGLK